MGGCAALPIMEKNFSEVCSSTYFVLNQHSLPEYSDHLHRYDCQQYLLSLISFLHLLPDNIADVQSHIFSHQLDFSTWCFHRSLKLNGTQTEPTVFPIHAVFSVVFLSRFTQVAIPEFRSHPQLPCSTYPSNSRLSTIDSNS